MPGSLAVAPGEADVRVRAVGAAAGRARGRALRAGVARVLRADHRAPCVVAREVAPVVAQGERMLVVPAGELRAVVLLVVAAAPAEKPEQGSGNQGACHWAPGHRHTRAPGVTAESWQV